MRTSLLTDIALLLPAYLAAAVEGAASSKLRADRSVQLGKYESAQP